MQNHFTLRRLEPSDPRPAFDCSDDDLNEYYLKDSVNYGQQLLAVTYVAEVEDKVAAFFSVSNDAVRKEDAPRTPLQRAINVIPRIKRHKSTPAVKIGRLATDKDFQCQGYGTDLLDFIKVWFTQGNKTGCRFIIIDAYNQSRVTEFYQRNGFKFLSSQDEKENTRLMYFDLIFQE